MVEQRFCKAKVPSSNLGVGSVVINSDIALVVLQMVYWSMKSCRNCGELLKRRHQKKFCSNQCQKDFQYKEYIKRWKNDLVGGSRGILTKNLSGHLKRYLVLKYGSKCSVCGWSKKHPVTGNIPLEIDHADGNADNNSEINLRPLCPNCHALTPHFRNLNKGNGRIWRKLKK